MVTPKNERQKKGPSAPVPQGPNLWMQLSAAFAVFLVISVGYSLVREYVTTQDEVVPISQIAADITSGSIVSIKVEGDQVTATYADKSVKTSRKESQSALTDTLSKFNIPAERLSAVKIAVEDEGGCDDMLMMAKFI